MYEHLIETTMSGYEQRTFTLGLGVLPSDLTEEELFVLAQSREYELKYEIKQKIKELKLAYQDFERLRDISGMPEEAIDILKRWTTRDGDEEEID